MVQQPSRALMQRLIAPTIKLAGDETERETATAILLELNQLASHAQGGARAQARRVLETLFQRLTRLVSRRPDQAGYAQVMIEDLNVLAAEMRVWEEPPPSAEGRAAEAPRFGRSTTYHIRHGPRGLRLVEHREGTQKDFYLTKRDYDKAVEAIGRVARPEAAFDEIREQFRYLGGSDVSSAYPLRMVLRFLRSRQPPLLTGQRRRYRLTLDSNAFRKAAHRAWTELPPHTDSP